MGLVVVKLIATKDENHDEVVIKGLKENIRRAATLVSHMSSLEKKLREMDLINKA